GFHQIRITRTEEEKKKIYKKIDVDNQIKTTRAIALALINYLASIHEDLSKLHLLLEAPAEKINLVTNEQALTLGINVMDDTAEEFIEAIAIQQRVQGAVK
ncbi:MAG TPA: hypothetical protein VE986_01040, partial [Hyphomicrobiales bacterium]|nr:hypothetical protein [Hyphomicrobiales bacterium]